jgi:UDP-N-acetylglucosamine--N-acetylmuramyl-(pentapeptide) pyrophosphoryl-undecaprenol N-acetylglucosamine transferase
VENAGINYYAISSGKLRRYLNLQNLTDVFRVVKGVGDAFGILRRVKPELVFSKGGFVSVPVVIAARLMGIKTIIHESDITPGLANKISLPFAHRICFTFPETAAHIKKKGVLTGTPIREELYKGSIAAAKDVCKFQNSNPTILVMGGSQGSVKINDCLRRTLPNLLNDFNVIHLCGRGNVSQAADARGYKQFEYVSSELPHLLAYADLVISRAGSNSINELLALRKPNLLIPLSRDASRGDQILNARSYEKQGFSMLLYEEELSDVSLINKINELNAKRKEFINAMSKYQLSDGTKNVLKVIEEEDFGITKPKQNGTPS